MQQLQISLFGKFGLRYGDRVVSALGSYKVQELLCYLLLFRGRPHSRESLANLLWEHCTTAQSKAYLRKALWELQHVVDEQAASGLKPVLRVEADWVEIRSGNHIWLDVAVFENAFTQVRDVPGLHLTDDHLRLLNHASGLYKSQLLENCYQEWCLQLRERYQQMYLSMQDKLLDHSEAHQKFDRGEEYGARILVVDPAREQTHRQLMRLRYQAGDRTGALRQYESCVNALNEELSVKPSRDTTELYEKIRSGVAPAEMGMLASPSGTGLDRLHRRIERIKDLQEKLEVVQRELQTEILAVEQAFHNRNW